MKQRIFYFFRRIGIAALADKSRYYMQYLKRFRSNNNFAKAHADFIFPPAYFIYETYTLNYKDYFEDGKQTAGEIIDLLAPYLNLNEALRVLDWGCGPARVVRHIPLLIKETSVVYGCDYNDEYVQWGRKNIPQISFIKNNIEPPVPLANDLLNAVYGLSIFTHLSERNHFLWIDELYRILKPGGVLLITTQGEKFKQKLLPTEALQFDAGQLVVRNFEEEGHRMYSAFQPEKFMQKLLSKFKILRFIPGGSAESVHHLQDTWIVQK